MGEENSMEGRGGGEDGKRNSGFQWMRIARAFFAATVLLPASLFSGWQDNLAPDVAGPFPAMRPFDAEFKIGWSDVVEAAHARADVGYQGGNIHLSAEGGTTGLARVLWQLDATLEATSSKQNFRTIYSVQKESYANRTISTQIVARPDGIWRLRENMPPGENPATWKKIKISPLRDLFSGMLFIRSRSFAVGETVSTIVFPGDSPFLVEMKSLGVEKINVAGTSHEAIKLDLRIQRINLKKGAKLEPHGKFHSGTVWLSNDNDRIPLRAEVNIFIGYVFAELESINFKTK